MPQNSGKESNNTLVPYYGKTGREFPQTLIIVLMLGGVLSELTPVNGVETQEHQDLKSNIMGC